MHNFSFLSRYHNSLETSVKGSNFVFDSNQLPYYKCHRIIFRQGGSYIDSPDWMKKMEVKINPKNNDDKGF